jgi:chemotaxis protein CheD
MTTAVDLVGMGDVHAAAGGEFNCLCVGSGIVVAAYDAQMKVGACAHFILPKAPPAFDPKKPGKYVNTGIAELLRCMVSLGAEKSHIRMALAGGSSLMSSSELAPMADLGARNLEAARVALEEAGFTCVAQDVGGQIGRSVTLSTTDGAVRVRTCVQPDRVLCKLRG